MVAFGKRLKQKLVKIQYIGEWQPQRLEVGGERLIQHRPGRISTHNLVSAYERERERERERQGEREGV